MGGVLLLDALLELEHHRTGGIDDLDVVTACQLIGLGRFAVGAEEHLDVVEFAEFVMVDGDESHFTEAFALHAVVYDVAEAVECTAVGQFFFGLGDGGGHPEAEATAVIDFDLNHFFNKSKYKSSRSWAATKDVFWPARTICSAGCNCARIAGLL